ncbi:hypothetical protein Bra3105_06765 [Brachybacterium halotolerans subsp. kimchii]|uniref:hypothetical protein n=1 Tax=Brachybacterium halotolerans TaxID=2795215 RepID=UPI001E46EBD8|nr:hypothetical protein [Brachybacterium halotolerans]UEJ84009.1 hypothetical protein Bra3105_06765 [Brachybacterium halotolerans subsp. kimchii]
MRRITTALAIRRRLEGAKDIYNNPKKAHGEPEAWPVYAVSPRSSTEPQEPNRDLVITGITVFAPVGGPTPGPHDLVDYGDDTWQVTGKVGTWDENPHVVSTRQHGIVVNLDRTEG